MLAKATLNACLPVCLCPCATGQQPAAAGAPSPAAAAAAAAATAGKAPAATATAIPTELRDALAKLLAAQRAESDRGITDGPATLAIKTLLAQPAQPSLNVNQTLNLLSYLKGSVAAPGVAGAGDAKAKAGPSGTTAAAAAAAASALLAANKPGRKVVSQTRLDDIGASGAAPGAGKATVKTETAQPTGVTLQGTYACLCVCVCVCVFSRDAFVWENALCVRVYAVCCARDA